MVEAPTVETRQDVASTSQDSEQEESHKRVLFCRSGGSFPGIQIHVGIWKALHDEGIEATHCVGTSAGAVVSWLDALGYAPNELIPDVVQLERLRLKQLRFAWQLRLPWLQAVCRTDRIRAMLNAYGRETFAKCCQVVATDVERADSVIFSAPALDEVMASMAVPMLFPPVTVNYREYIDGGVCDNLPVAPGWPHFDEVYLLIARRPVTFADRNRNAISRGLHALDVMMMDQVQDTIDALRTHCYRLRADGRPAPTVRVLWSNVETPKGSLEFDATLVADAYADAKETIATWGLNEGENRE